MNIHTGLLRCPGGYRLSLNTETLSQIFHNQLSNRFGKVFEGFAAYLARERNSATRRFMPLSWFTEGRLQNPVHRVLLHSSVFDKP